MLDSISSEVPMTDLDPVVKAPKAAKLTEADKFYPESVLKGQVSTRKLPHRNLILDGVCSNCGHCWQPLTDSVSVHRGIGPVCAKKGYAEDPVDGDENQALIDLAEFPELVEFLVTEYKPLGIRGLVNGLVRVASLNRPHGPGGSLGNVDVFSACCDAIESLGHLKMADLLRKSLVVVTVEESKTMKGIYTVFVRKNQLPSWWFYKIRQNINFAAWVSYEKCYEIRLYDFSIEEQGVEVPSKIPGITNKRALWNLLKEAFPRMVAQTPTGIVKIGHGK